MENQMPYKITFTLIGILCVLVGYQIRLVIQKLEEKALYKEIIFKEKINMYREIYEGLNKTYTKDFDSFGDISNLNDVIFKYSSVIPVGVWLKCSEHINKMIKIYQRNKDEEISEEISEEALSMYGSIVKESRQDLGVEILSEETENYLRRILAFITKSLNNTAHKQR